MESIIRFILFTGIFYLVYILLFRHLSFYRTNRFLILLIPMISALIPLVAPAFSSPLPREVLSFQLPEIILQQKSPGEPVTTSSAFNWIALFYFLIAAFLLAGMLRGIYKGFTILRHASLKGGIYYSPSAESPFTFFKAIVIPESLVHHKDLPAIIVHEQVHVKQYHSLDNLFYGLWTSIAWFNPFIHLLAKELRQTHECLADEQALQNTSREEYAKLLLSSVFGSEINLSPMAMGTANPFFNSSLIKTRITMIYKQKTKKHLQWLYLALLPIFTAMFLFSCSKTEEAPVEKKSETITEEQTLGFAEADSPPLFPDCDPNASKEEKVACFQKGIIKHVQQNFKYPEKAQELKMEGKVYVGFVVDEAGNITNTEIKRGLTANTEAEEEAVLETDEHVKGMMKSLPRLAPAIKDGKRVAVSFVLPVNMKLD